MRAVDPARARRALRVVVAGGGTGGHLFPGIAVADAFRAQNAQTAILFVGAGGPFEKDALARAGYPRQSIAIEGIKGRRMWSRARAVLKIPVAVFQAAGILAQMDAELVVGVGGYAAGPVAAAAWMKGIPVVLCEQNTIPGITNRMLFPIARRVYLSFEHTRGRIAASKKRVSGNPIRQPVLAGGGTPDGRGQRFTVLVVGGSQGAHAINMAFIEALPHLRRRHTLRILHQTGASDRDPVAAAYAGAGVDAEVKSFFHDMASRYSQADLVVCRAGATTVAELAALGKAALFIPYPFAADNHQEHNARALTEAGAAQMVLEKDLSGKTLAGRLDDLAHDSDRLAKMAKQAKELGRPDAAEYIVNDCYQMLGDNTRDAQ